MEAVERLDERFDLIVCTGVLHHLADPDAGLCALLVLDAQDKRLFDAIDGQRNVRQVVETADVPWFSARTLFEKLWWYDQIVFDASGAR